jgi:hypothetical protein
MRLGKHADRRQRARATGIRLLLEPQAGPRTGPAICSPGIPRLEGSMNPRHWVVSFGHRSVVYQYAETADQARRQARIEIWIFTGRWLPIYSVTSIPEA